jgi:integrase
LKIVQRGKNTYRITWELGRLDGKRRQRTETFHGTFREAQRRAREVQAEIDAGRITDPRDLTLEELVRRWLDQVAALRVKPSTLASYQRNLGQHVLPRLGSVKVGKLSALQLQELYADLLRSGRRDGRPGGLSPRTVRYCHTLLVAVLGWAVRSGVVSRNVAQATEPPRERSNEVPFWTEDQVQAFLAVARFHRLSALWELALGTALRQGELLGLMWEDVDLEAGYVVVRRQLGRSGHLEDLKTRNARRTVALGPRLVESLRRHRIRQLEERLAAGPFWEESGLVFVTQRGRPLSHRNVLRALHTLAARAGVPRIPFHGLRHTHATLLHLSGAPLRALSERLGHAEPAFTASRYAHTLPAIQRELALRADILLFGDGDQVGDQRAKKGPAPGS